MMALVVIDASMALSFMFEDEGGDAARLVELAERFYLLAPPNFRVEVVNAVAMAGGYTYRARQNDLYIKRLDSSGRMVRIAAKPETKVRPGDTVEIKERYF